ncbi:MAG: hypothetical protein HXS41_00340 [Theionarchaea archaeon]|nr:hypothetical protein [Theionarchaea archaeon]MBU7019479.1 hypothetical protein [Theionarchaea archaeon]MBU7035421.1 hypothetical protein [Theionarchaea archaeon]MBU7041244.1 hypothetical protein [Theionarchaea archaeon]
MSCYFRHMSDVFQKAGVVITKENKKDVDRALHSLVGVEYKDCSSTWRELKILLQDEEGKERVIKTIRGL